LAEAGRVDDLINNAGYGYWGAVEETSEESVEKIFDINVFGPLRLIRAIAPIMRSQGSGVIVQISSMGGRIVSPMIGVYQASKHALEAVSEALAYELAPFGVRVAIIEPGNVDSAPRIEICGRLVDKSSAYQGLHQMFVERKKSRPQAKATPDSVADAVLAAIEEPMCPLRMLVGEDAVAADGVRRSRNDAGYAQWLWDYLQFRW
jgi:short-subunit dehydrogenase